MFVIHIHKPCAQVNYFVYHDITVIKLSFFIHECLGYFSKGKKNYIDHTFSCPMVQCFSVKFILTDIIMTLIKLHSNFRCQSLKSLEKLIFFF